MDLYQNSHHGSSYEYRKRRTKSDWAGISIGDAFKRNTDYHIRLQAQREFYQMVKKIQLVLAKGLFAAGDMARGQSLIVRAIADGRRAAQRIVNWYGNR